MSKVTERGYSAVSHRTREILLLEDNPADTHLFLTVLSAIAGQHHVTAAETGAQALDLLYQRGRYAKTPRPDLVVMDLNVPILSGHEVLNVIKSSSILRSIPVVVWSGSSDQNDVRRAYDLGASAYLVKPADFEDLESTLAEFAAFWIGRVIYPDRANIPAIIGR
jgi:CheY-like chemotaxis protein